MAEYGLNKNAEGYADPTAYEGIRGAAKPGEIWMYKGRECLIVKNHGGYCNILQLGTYKKNSIEVAGWYAQPGMISYAFNDLLSEYVKRITTDEFAHVLDEVEDALCLTFIKEADSMANPIPDPAASHEVEDMKHELDAMRVRIKEADSMANEYADRYKEEKAKADTYKIQLDMMKSMYSDLMEKFLQRA